MKAFKLCSWVVVMLVAVFMSANSFGYQIPYDDSNVKYFYVFGEDGDPLMGKEDSLQEIFIDVPASTNEDLVVKVYDPDTVDNVDWQKPDDTVWDTNCEFSFYGSSLLEKKLFSDEMEYNKHFYTFGPYKKTQGEKVGEFITNQHITASPVIGIDGTIYICTENCLYAVETNCGGPADSPWPMLDQNAQHTRKLP